MLDGNLLVGAVSANADRGLGREIQECADGAAGLFAGTQFQDLAEQDKNSDDAGGLEVNRRMAGKECSNNAVEEGSACSERDEREHVEAAAHQGRPTAPEQWCSGPQHDRDGEYELQPIGAEPAHIEC